MNYKQIRAVFQGGAVRRFHTLPTVGVDTVASHSFGVAMLAWMLCKGAPSRALVQKCLVHDIPEQTFGDIPSPAKKFLESEKLARAEDSLLEENGLHPGTLTEEDERVFKLADNLDGLRFCIEEYNKGNSGLLECERNYCRYITDMLPNEHETMIFHGILSLRRNKYERE